MSRRRVRLRTERHNALAWRRLWFNKYAGKKALAERRNRSALLQCSLPPGLSIGVVLVLRVISPVHRVCMFGVRPGDAQCNMRMRNVLSNALDNTFSQQPITFASLGMSGSSS